MSDDKKNEEIYDTLTEEESREEELHKARKARAEKMHEEKQRSMQIRRYGAIGAAVAISVIVLIAVVVKQKNKVDPRAIEPQTETVTQSHSFLFIQLHHTVLHCNRNNLTHSQFHCFLYDQFHLVSFWESLEQIDFMCELCSEFILLINVQPDLVL